MTSHADATALNDAAEDERTAQAVGRKLGIDEVIADVLPEVKASVTLVSAALSAQSIFHALRLRAVKL